MEKLTDNEIAYLKLILLDRHGFVHDEHERRPDDVYRPMMSHRWWRAS